jgi:hypothetical protein
MYASPFCLLLYWKNSRGSEKWYKYDEYGNKIHFKDNRGHEKFY